MEWFVLRTLAGKEERVILLFRHLFNDVEIVFPKRRLSWRKQGKTIDVIKPLFSGYLFIAANIKRINELNLWLQHIKIGAWFVKIGNIIAPITAEEIQMIQQLMCNGEIIERSEILKLGETVTIVRGPLVGMEGIVEKYSKRDRRIIVKVTIAGKEKQVALEGTWVDSGGSGRMRGCLIKS